MINISQKCPIATEAAKAPTVPIVTINPGTYPTTSNPLFLSLGNNSSSTNHTPTVNHTRCDAAYTFQRFPKDLFTKQQRLRGEYACDYGMYTMNN